VLPKFFQQAQVTLKTVVMSAENTAAPPQEYNAFLKYIKLENELH